MKKSTTKRALIASMLSLVMCFGMLTGTTFAWFTDTVTSGSNIIAAGNLDVELYNGDKQITGEDTDPTFFDDVADGKWEPGAMAWETFTVKNVGTLALKYALEFNVTEPTSGVSLAEALKIAVIDGELNDTQTRIDPADYTWQSFESFVLNGNLESKTEDVRTFIVWWEPSDNDNDYNMNNENKDKVASVEFNLVLKATQLSSEGDSFGSDYDAGAPWLGGIDLDWYDPAATEYTISSAEQLAGLAAIVNGTATSPVTTFAATAPTEVHDDFEGKTVKLGGDVDLNGIEWTPIGRIGTTSTDFTYAFRGTFDGQGYTIYNLEVSNDGWAGFFGIAYKAEIKNLKLNGVTLNSSRMTGSVVGQLYGSLDNCHVENANIKVVPNAVGTSYDNGDKVGGIVGWIGDNGNNRTLTNCSATGVTLSAYRDVGGIAGYVASSTVVSGNKATNVTITVDQTTNHYGEKDTNAGAIIGRDNGANVDDTNTTSEIIISETYYKNGLTLFEDGSGEVVLYLVPSDYAEKTVNVPEGVTAIGGYAFAYNSNVETIVLSSSVKTLNDRAFRDTSASTVVLNEGLENISYQAFRNALNVKEVVIPSTVKTISKEAFQNSGVTSLIIPANVETIEYGGLRDMKMLESVVIEGNVNIPIYAFRACTNLRTVILNGDDVTFGDGSRGMIFTNKESGDGTAITVYVANQTVKDRLLAIDTAAKDYGGYAIVITSEIPEDKELSDVLTDGADSVYVPADKYATFPSDKVSEGDVIVCAPGTVFEGTSSLNISGATVIGATFKNENGIAVTQTISGTFKDCVFEGSEALRWCYSTAGDTVVFENCVIKTDFRGIHFDGMDGNVIFRNCEINGFNAFGGTGTVTFEGCTFGYDESYYNGLNMYCNTVLKNCKFEYRSNKSNFVDFEAAGMKLEIENCTATMNGEEASILDFVGGTYKSQTTIIVDGAYYATSNTQLTSAIAAGAETVVLAAGNYTMPEPDLRGKTLTIKGSKDAVIDATAVDARDQFVTGATLAFEGITLNFGTVNYMGFANCASLTYKDCQINGLQFLFGEKVTFENCDLNSNGAEHCVWTYGVKNVDFIGCDFTYGDRGINCYSDNDVAGGKQTVNFKDCTFATENTASEGAVEINSTYFSVGIEVNMTGCTAPAYGEMAYVSPWDSTNGAKTTINIK